MIGRPALPVSAPARVRERLRAAPDGPVRVLHRGRHAVYVEVPGGCVGVLARAAAPVPCGLRSTATDLADAGHHAAVRDGVLRLDGRALVVGRVVDVRVPRLSRPPAAPAGARPLAAADLVDLLPHLVGRGEGLTPLGDDVVCGWLAAHRAAGRPTPAVDHAVRSLLPRTTAVSAALLDCALHGEALPAFSSYLSSLGTPGEDAATTALLAVGHTSGAGLLHGARLALAALAHPIGAAA